MDATWVQKSQTNFSLLTTTGFKCIFYATQNENVFGADDCVAGHLEIFSLFLGRNS